MKTRAWQRNQMTQSHGTFFWAPLNKQLWFTISKTELQAALCTRPGTQLKKDTPPETLFHLCKYKTSTGCHCKFPSIFKFLYTKEPAVKNSSSE